MGAYTGAARRRVHLATVLPQPPSERQARHAHILRIGLRLAIAQTPGRPRHGSSPSDVDKIESDEQDPPQGVAPHAHKGVVGAHELCR